ncbi:hypothetical protein O9K51_02844 [Purpureocillium lavendulum]|uniref:Uncharacterized protein n=1 Tax=Purpureocillium lavendulum TaxID=1247861 RepID=A0AB34G2F5_9HYPO|nr:hypothetical protein O9K51_02844 [Purpureocillium lavendulum]
MQSLKAYGEHIMTMKALNVYIHRILIMDRSTLLALVLLFPNPTAAVLPSTTEYFTNWCQAQHHKSTFNMKHFGEACYESKNYCSYLKWHTKEIVKDLKSQTEVYQGSVAETCTEGKVSTHL